MGQSVSRNLATRLEGGLAKARHQMEQQMREEAKHKLDPNAAIGFTRGAGTGGDSSGGDVRDAQQEAFLREKQRRSGVVDNGQPQEMPPDLLKFLNDVGPLQQSVDRDFTSVRIRDSLQASTNNSKNNMEHQDTRRTVRSMPLMGKDDTHTTSRTTSFSHTASTQDTDFGLTEVQFYEMFAVNKSMEELWKEANGTQDNDQEKEEQMKMMELCRKYLTVPDIYQDKDEDFIGIHPNDPEAIEAIKFTMKPAKGIKLVLSQLLDRSNEEKARQRLEEASGQ